MKKLITLFLIVLIASSCIKPVQKSETAIIKKEKKIKIVRLSKIPAETEFDKVIREHIQNMKKNRSYELLWY